MTINHLACPEAAWLLLLPLAVYFLLPALKRTYGEALKIPFLADIKQIQTQSGNNALISPKIAAGIRGILLLAAWCLLVFALCACRMSRGSVMGGTARLFMQNY